MGRLDDKVVIVTGAGRGIGRGIVEKLAAEGARVVVSDVDEESARDTAEAVGGGAVGLRADVTSKESVEAMVAEVVERFGRVDVLVNNAGWDKVEPFLKSNESDWERVIAINLYGTLHCCKAVLPVMVEQEYGKVVNIGSDAGRVGSSGRRSTRRRRAGSSPSPRRSPARWLVTRSTSTASVPVPPTRRCSPRSGRRTRSSGRPCKRRFRSGDWRSPRISR